MSEMDSVPATRLSVQELVERARRSAATHYQRQARHSSMTANHPPAESTASGHALKPFHLVRVRDWPDLRPMPMQDVELAARICALLMRRLTAVHLVHRILQEPEERVHKLLTQLHGTGSLRIATIGGDTYKSPDSAETSQAAFRPGRWQQLWHKLIHGK